MARLVGQKCHFLTRNGSEIPGFMAKMVQKHHCFALKQWILAKTVDFG